MNEPAAWTTTHQAAWHDDVPAEPMRWPRLTSALALGAGYGLAAALSLFFGRQPGTIATVWFANAVAVTYLLFRPPPAWPLPLLAVAVANVLANRAWGDGWAAAALFVPANLLAIVAGAALLRRAGLHGSTLRGAQPLLRLWVWGGLVPELAGATLGALLLGMHGAGAPGLFWLQWMEGALIGAISTLPLAFLFFRVGWAGLRDALVDWRVAALGAASVAVALLSLAHVPFPFIYLILVLLLAAMTLEFAAVALITLCLSLVVALSMATGLFVPPPITSEWQSVYVYMAYASALVPAQLLAGAVAELRDSHARLAHRGAALRRTNEALEQFVRIASHDLREPLNTVVQFSALIEDDHAERLPPEGMRYLRLVRSAATRMRTLLDDVLQYTRVQGGELDSVTPVSLDAVMADVRTALAGRLHDSRATLRVGALPVVRGHPAMLSLLLQNLVANALKFVPPERRPEVDVSARTEGADAWVTVADNGIGIAEGDIGKLFRPFQRLHLRRQYEGSGLGLALCRQIARAHGGEVVVASVPGEGSRFTVRLPLASDAT